MMTRNPDGTYSFTNVAGPGQLQSQIIDPGSLNLPTLPTGGSPQAKKTSTTTAPPQFITQTIPAGSGASYIPGSGFTTSFYPGTNVPMFTGGTQQVTNPAYTAYQQQNNPQNMPTNTTIGAGGDIGGLPTAPPDLASITQLVNQLNLQAQQQANAGRIPGAAGLEQQSSGNIASLLAGNIPADVKRNLTQSAAERGVAMGSPGSANSDAALMQALGLTSLGLQQQGQSNLTSALGRNPAAPIFDPSQLLLTPAQKLQADLANKYFQLAWLRSMPQNTLPIRRTGGGGGSGMPTGTGSDWFGDAFRRATGGAGVQVPQYPGPIPYKDPYGGFNPEWPSDTSGDVPVDPYGGYNPEWPSDNYSSQYPDTYSQVGFLDASSPSYWDPSFQQDVVQGSSSYDPFSEYYSNPEWGD